MAYPSSEQLQEALLTLLYQSGGEKHEMRSAETYRILADHFSLSSIERRKTRAEVLGDDRKEAYWNNVVQTAREALRKAGYLAESNRGFWRLSDAGIQRIAPTLDAMGAENTYPDEVTSAVTEGAKKSVLVNAYERSALARKACIEHYGYTCIVCSTNLEAVYGERGRRFIHVHHIVPISSIGDSYEISPIEDLRPVCPNCHAILHRTDPPCSIEDLQKIFNP